MVYIANIHTYSILEREMFVNKQPYNSAGADPESLERGGVDLKADFDIHGKTIK